MTYILFNNQFPIPQIKGGLMFCDFGGWPIVAMVNATNPMIFVVIYYACRVRKLKSTFFIFMDIA
jgi:hypothetical protein